MTTEMSPYSWSTSQLVEFLAVLSGQPDESTMLRAAVERALEALDAEIGVLLSRRAAPTIVGLSATDSRVPAIIEAAKTDTSTVTIPEIGLCHASTIRLNIEDDELVLFVARSGMEAFAPEETLLLRGMTWVLHLALRPLRMLVTLEERERVLHHMAVVQRAIVNRAPLTRIVDTVTEAALDLLHCELAMLYLVEQGILMLASVSAVNDMYRPPEWPIQLRSSLARAAFVNEKLVRTDDYGNSEYANKLLVLLGAHAAMAAPVRENGTVVGCLMTMSFQSGHVYTEVQEQTMLTFADQISTALSDAKTLTTAQHAVRDPVTGLPNRVFFLDRLERAIDRGLTPQVLFIDLDRFKIVNDTLGHAAGDDLLRQVGRRIRECLDKNHILARFGGDEFAVLVEDAEHPTRMARCEEMARLGRRLLAAIQKPYSLEGGEVNVGASVGIAECAESRSSEDVLRAADTAMYQAKHSGGNRLVIFDRAARTASRSPVSPAKDLRNAVDRDELFCVFQPICDLHDGRVHAAEALVRWRHPVRGLVGPDAFIPLAEDTGLIIPLGRQVLRRACEEAASWPDPSANHPPLGVAVNVSARQLSDPYLVTDIGDALSASGLDPSRLHIEVPQSTLFGTAPNAPNLLGQIKNTGVQVSIDGFGTGYSSLSYLRRIPADTLKIDRSFIGGIVEGWQGQTFLHAIVRLAEALSMAVVGAGIETEEQLSALRILGCRLGQGYLLARPMTSSELGLRLIHSAETGQATTPFGRPQCQVP